MDKEAWHAAIHGKVQLKKQTPQVPVQQESKQGFLNTELNFKSSLYLYFSLSSFALSKIDTSMSWAIQNNPQQEQLCLHRVGRSERQHGEKKKQPAGFLRDYVAPAFILLLSYFGAKKAAGRSLLCSQKAFHQKGWSSLRAAWFPLGLTDLISLLSKGLSRDFSSTTIQKHQFFSTQPSLRSNSHICTWLLEKP